MLGDCSYFHRIQSLPGQGYGQVGRLPSVSSVVAWSVGVEDTAPGVHCLASSAELIDEPQIQHENLSQNIPWGAVE